MMLHLFIARHGQTAWNLQQRFQGHTDVPLDDVGRLQASRLAERISREGVSLVVTSDLIRARETAEMAAARSGCDCVTTPLLREAGFGEWEGKTRGEIEGTDPGAFAAYHNDSVHHRPPGAESLGEVRARVLTALNDIRSRVSDGSVLVVGHGGSMRWIIVEALGAPRETYRRLRTDNASLSMVELVGDRSWLSLFNDVSHLQGLLSDTTVSVSLNQ